MGGAINIAAAAPAGLGSTQAVGAAASSAIANSGIPASLDSLVKALQGFGTAEILLALMMMGGDQNRSQKTGDAAMAMLAGLALAGNLAGMSASLNRAASGISTAGCGIGLQINLQI